VTACDQAELATRVDWFKSSNKNHDWNQAIKIKKIMSF